MFYNMNLLLQLFLQAYLEMYLTTAIWKTKVQLTQCSTTRVKVKNYHALNYFKVFHFIYYRPNKTEKFHVLFCHYHSVQQEAWTTGLL